MSKRTAVYDVYLREQLIYVGSSSKPKERMHSHRIKGIVPRHAKLEIVAWYETRKEALAAERTRIEQLRPPCNINFNEEHEARQKTLQDEREKQMAEGRAFWAELERQAVAYAKKLHRDGLTFEQISAKMMNIDPAAIEKVVSQPD